VHSFSLCPRILLTPALASASQSCTPLPSPADNDRKMKGTMIVGFLIERSWRHAVPWLTGIGCGLGSKVHVPYRVCIRCPCYPSRQQCRSTVTVTKQRSVTCIQAKLRSRPGSPFRIPPKGTPICCLFFSQPSRVAIAFRPIPATAVQCPAHHVFHFLLCHHSVSIFFVPPAFLHDLQTSLFCLSLSLIRCRRLQSQI